MTALLEEGGDISGGEEQNTEDSWRRKSNFRIRSTSMPQFRKNKHRLGVFLDLVQYDFSKINWLCGTSDNLSPDEHLVLHELQEEDRLVIKKK